MINLNEYKARYPDIWTYTGEDPVAFLDALELQRLIDPGDVTEWKEKVLASDVPAINDYRARWWDISLLYPDDTMFLDALVTGRFISLAERAMLIEKRVPEEIPAEAVLPRQVFEAIFENQKPWYEMTMREVLRSLWAWMLQNVNELIDRIGGHIRAAFEQYWPPVKDKLEEAGRWIYDTTNKALLSIGEVTPERATEMGWKMFGIAMGAGITAHMLSVGFELIHPFKSLGFHQMTGMVAQLGSFGPVSAATLGQVHYAALRRPMSYAVNKVTRSQIPDDQLLQIMAVKPDIPMDQFVETMKYHGYSDYWIDRIKTTMFHEPRYFELKMMSEDVAATDEWLRRKVRRAGYNDEDADVFVHSLRASAIRMQRLDYYKQGFYLFKEGYIPREYFNRILDDLELLPEAKKFCTLAAELAYLLDVTKDEVKYWTDSYLKDLVTQEELEVQLTLLGINRWRVELMVRLARVRKYKKPGKPVATELEKVMNQARAKYSQAYVQLYRKELITVEDLESNLVALGIHPELAQASCALEEARKMS